MPCGGHLGHGGLPMTSCILGIDLSGPGNVDHTADAPLTVGLDAP